MKNIIKKIMSIIFIFSTAVVINMEVEKNLTISININEFTKIKEIFQSQINGIDNEFQLTLQQETEEKQNYYHDQTFQKQSFLTRNIENEYIQSLKDLNNLKNNICNLLTTNVEKIKIIYDVLNFTDFKLNTQINNLITQINNFKTLKIFEITTNDTIEILRKNSSIREFINIETIKNEINEIITLYNKFITRINDELSKNSVHLIMENLSKIIDFFKGDTMIDNYFSILLLIYYNLDGNNTDDYGLLIQKLKEIKTNLLEETEKNDNILIKKIFINYFIKEINGLINYKILITQPDSPIKETLINENEKDNQLNITNIQLESPIKETLINEEERVNIIEINEKSPINPLNNLNQPMKITPDKSPIKFNSFIEQDPLLYNDKDKAFHNLRYYKETLSKIDEEIAILKKETNNFKKIFINNVKDLQTQEIIFEEIPNIIKYIINCFNQYKNNLDIKTIVTQGDIDLYSTLFEKITQYIDILKEQLNSENYEKINIQKQTLEDCIDNMSILINIIINKLQNIQENNYELRIELNNAQKEIKNNINIIYDFIDLETKVNLIIELINKKIEYIDNNIKSDIQDSSTNRKQKVDNICNIINEKIKYITNEINIINEKIKYITNEINNNKELNKELNEELNKELNKELNNTKELNEELKKDLIVYNDFLEILQNYLKTINQLDNNTEEEETINQLDNNTEEETINEIMNYVLMNSLETDQKNLTNYIEIIQNLNKKIVKNENVDENKNQQLILEKEISNIIDNLFKKISFSDEEIDNFYNEYNKAQENFINELTHQFADSKNQLVDFILKIPEEMLQEQEIKKQKIIEEIKSLEDNNPEIISAIHHQEQEQYIRTLESEENDQQDDNFIYHYDNNDDEPLQEISFFIINDKLSTMDMENINIFFNNITEKNQKLKNDLHLIEEENNMNNNSQITKMIEDIEKVKEEQKTIVLKNFKRIYLNNNTNLFIIEPSYEEIIKRNQEKIQQKKEQLFEQYLINFVSYENNPIVFIPLTHSDVQLLNQSFSENQSSSNQKPQEYLYHDNFNDSRSARQNSYENDLIDLPFEDDPNQEKTLSNESKNNGSNDVENDNTEQISEKINMENNLQLINLSQHQSDTPTSSEHNSIINTMDNIFNNSKNIDKTFETINVNYENKSFFDKKQDSNISQLISPSLTNSSLSIKSSPIFSPMDNSFLFENSNNNKQYLSANIKQKNVNFDNDSSITNTSSKFSDKKKQIIDNELETTLILNNLNNIIPEEDLSRTYVLSQNELHLSLFNEDETIIENKIFFDENLSEINKSFHNSNVDSDVLEEILSFLKISNLPNDSLLNQSLDKDEQTQIIKVNPALGIDTPLDQNKDLFNEKEESENSILLNQSLDKYEQAQVITEKPALSIDTPLDQNEDLFNENQEYENNLTIIFKFHKFFMKLLKNYKNIKKLLLIIINFQIIFIINNKVFYIVIYNNIYNKLLFNEYLYKTPLKK